MLLARTNWHVPKHAGITYFVLPMRQEGVTVRPLRQMNGHASFNQVFLTEARIPKDHVIGEVDGGWSVARTTLAHERRYGAMRPPSFGPSASASASANATPARAVEEARAEAARHFAPYVWYPQRAGRVDLLVERCRATGRDRDPIARQEVARVLSLHRVSGWTAERARANRAAGRPPGPEGSIGKLALSVVARAAARAHSLIAGSSALVVGGDAPLKGTISEVLLSVPAQSIAGGTDEIQRNIVAERILGLPREPSTVKPSLKGA
jgi:alkylation response protein AidB-like acyl-CoA dehydrogenase